MKEHFENLNASLNKAHERKLSPEIINSLSALIEVYAEPDPNLRDKLGWKALSRCFNEIYLPKEIRLSLLDKLISPDFLFFKIDDGETDATVKRSFAALGIADVITGDTNFKSELTSIKLKEVSAIISEYLQRENDFRGHELRLGWIHAPAHIADTIDALCAHAHITQEDCTKNVEAL